MGRMLDRAVGMNSIDAMPCYPQTKCKYKRICRGISQIWDAAFLASLTENGERDRRVKPIPPMKKYDSE
jgi:hypothetical protein